MEVIIDVPKKIYNRLKEPAGCMAGNTFHNTALWSIARGTPIPEGATNGDMIKAMFPDIKIHEHEKTDICDAYIQIDIWDFSIYVSKDWWNAPYKGVE